MKFDLENRLIKFAALIIDISEALPKTKAANHLCAQIIKSGTSPALNYGEAHSAESKKDFIHKMKVSLKELRETFNILRIFELKYPSTKRLNSAIDETNQLISIFVKSIKTAEANERMKRRK